MPAEFDRYAADYDELLRDSIRDGFAGGSHYFHRRKWELIRAYFAGRKQDTSRMRWLDAGSGRGELLALGRPSFLDAVGCDPAPGMAAASKIRTIHQPDVCRLPFGDAEFDFITAVCVFHHVPPAGRAPLAAEMARALKPGGVACVIEHNPANPVTRMIVNRTPVDAGAVLLPGGEAVKLLGQAGLRLIERRYFLYLPRALYAWAGWLERLLARVPAGGQYAVFAEKPK